MNGSSSGSSPGARNSERPSDRDRSRRLVERPCRSAVESSMPYVARRYGSSSGSPAGTTAIPPGGSASIASAFARATSATVPTSSRCSGPMEVTSASVGRAIGRARRSDRGRACPSRSRARASPARAGAPSTAGRARCCGSRPPRRSASRRRRALRARPSSWSSPSSRRPRRPGRPSVRGRARASAASAASWSRGTSVAAPLASASSTNAVPVFNATKRSPAPAIARVVVDRGAPRRRRVRRAARRAPAPRSRCQPSGITAPPIDRTTSRGELTQALSRATASVQPAERRPRHLAVVEGVHDAADVLALLVSLARRSRRRRPVAPPRWRTRSRSHGRGRPRRRCRSPAGSPPRSRADPPSEGCRS